MNALPSVDWHAEPMSQTWTALDTREAGLSADEARSRLETHGRNVLPRQTPPTFLLIVWRQFQSPLIYILGVAAIVSLAVHPDDPAEAIFIGVVLLINAAIGSYQEWRAEQSSRGLQKLLETRASVFRDGEPESISAEELVPGDVVLIESGNRVPADLRLYSTQGLEVDESLLTGESLPVAKQADWKGEPSAPPADRRNMTYAGSIVARGRGRGVVVATGSHTVIGQLAKDVADTAGGRPPLLERMEAFTRAVAIAILVAAVVIAVIGVAFRGYSVTEMFMFGVALAVSAIPEGLPIALTVALSLAANRMAGRGVIVRRLAAVEGLGSCTMIGSDKTGTLTCNELTVREIRRADGAALEVTGEGFAPEGEVRHDGKAVTVADEPELTDLGRIAVLCNEGDLRHEDDGWVWHGDPTDVALLSLGRKLGLRRDDLLKEWPAAGEIPFEPERQYAATFHRCSDGVRAFVKGAPERVLAMCAEPDGPAREHLTQTAAEMAERGYRVLALADGPGPADPKAADDPAGLIFRGFVGMIDPLRPGARDAVAACQSAGITVCMITGDHPVTALAIARDLGFADSLDQVITGRELDELSPEQMRDAVKRARVFARTTPRQKLELVRAAREAGHFVAVTGDGVNDAPALREANIGVAMGKSGTDVAREAAELVITDDNFATIVAGVEEGRVAYDNVRKVIYLLISTGVAEVIILGLAVLTGWPDTDDGLAVLPLLPVQILWLNLVTNGIQDVALAFEPAEADVLRRKPRPPRESVFNRLMIERTVIAALVMGILGFATFCWMIEVGGWTPVEARNGLLLLMVLCQMVHIGNCRSETTSAFGLSPFSSPILLGGTILAFGIHMISMHLPFMQRVLSVEPVSLTTFAILAGLSVSVLAAIELHKWWRKRFAE